MRYAPCLAAILSLWVRPAQGQSPAPGPTARDTVPKLAPAAFPKLPAAIQRDLEARHCLVPQPWDKPPGPANVVHGAFTAAGASEWAILCSVRDTSMIIIYRSSPKTGTRVVDSLQRSADVAWMQGVGAGRWGYSRLLTRRPQRLVRAWRRDFDGKNIPQPIDHDAIEEAFVGKSAFTYYGARGQWYRQLTAD